LIDNAFGDDNEVFATAHLVGAAFEINPLVPESELKSINQEKLTWYWSIFAKNPGQTPIDC